MVSTDEEKIRPAPEGEGSDRRIVTRSDFVSMIRVAYAQLFNAVMTYGPEWWSERESSEGAELERIARSLPAAQDATLDQMLFVACECSNKNFLFLNRLGIDGRDRRDSVKPACADLFRLMVEGMKSPLYGGEIKQIVDHHDLSLVCLPIKGYVKEIPRISKEPKLPADFSIYGLEFSKKALIAYCEFYNSAQAYGLGFVHRENAGIIPYTRQIPILMITCLPHPQHVLVGDIVEIGELVRTGSLEWLYRLGLDGEDMKKSLGSATEDLRNLVSSVKDPSLAETVSRASGHGRINAKLASKDCLELRKWVSRRLWESHELIHE